MRCNADRLIEGLITAQLKELQSINSATAEQPQRSQEKPKPIVVTVSRSFGAMGKEIALLLADTLEVRCCDHFILQEVARRANVDESLVKVLDEHISVISDRVSNHDEHWWKRLLNRQSFSYEDYYEYLAKTVLSISLHGGVIVGRGAHLILGPEKAFRVRITGTPEKCAERVAERESISLEQAIDQVHKIDNERAKYIQKLYHSDINDLRFYDLVLNTDRFNRIQTAELILTGLQRAGYKLPDDATASLGIMA